MTKAKKHMVGCLFFPALCILGLTLNVQTAQAQLRRVGRSPVARYNNDPAKRLLYMELPLHLPSVTRIKQYTNQTKRIDKTIGTTKTRIKKLPPTTQPKFTILIRKTLRLLNKMQ